MLRLCLVYLLTTLIALQSVVAVADVHQLHQTGDEHIAIEYEHSHIFLNGSIQKKQGKSNCLAEDSHLDCQHCCHCHNAFAFSLNTSCKNFSLTGEDRTLFDYQFCHSSYQASPDNPPPIS